MLSTAALRRSYFICASCRTRAFATKANKAPQKSAPPSGVAKNVAVDVAQVGGSSCSANTVLVGMNYLKGQEPVLALPDDEYPPWLWHLLEPKVLPDDGPGGKAEKLRLRKENRQRIRDQNLLKTQ